MKTNTEIIANNKFKKVDTYDIYIGLDSNISKEKLLTFHEIENIIFDFFTKNNSA